MLLLLIKMPRAVIFDIDGVLIDSFEASLKFFEDIMRHTGHPLPTAKKFGSVFHMTLRDALREVMGSADEEEVQRVHDISRGRIVPYPVSLIKYPDGMYEVIQELSRAYLLGIVTSRGRAVVYEAPKLAELQSYFKVAVSSEDTEHHKPHPAPLFLAAARLGVAPEECVYVGDAKTDVLAAHAAGMRCIAYSKVPVEGADETTSLFTDLPGFMRGL